MYGPILYYRTAHFLNSREISWSSFAEWGGCFRRWNQATSLPRSSNIWAVSGCCVTGSSPDR